MTSPSASTLSEAQHAYARGDHDRVIALLRPQADTAGPQALALLGNSALARGDDALAFAAYTRLLARQPGLEAARRALAGLHNRRGAAHRRAHREAAARADFERALHLFPTHREAGFNLALALDALGEGEAALNRLDAHLAAHPADDDAYWLAVEWQSRTAPAQAVQRLANVCAGHAPPRDPARLAAIANRLRQGAELEAARGLYEMAWRQTGCGERSPGLSYALAGRLAQPEIVDSTAQIAHQRAAFLQHVACLDAEWRSEHLARCEPALEQLAWSNFYLAYHGENDIALQSAYGALLTRAAHTLAPRWAQPPERAAAPRERRGHRIGLLSSSFRDCTAGAYFGGWVDWLREAGHDTRVYQLGPQRDAVTDAFATRATSFHYHEGTLADLAQCVHDDALDLLIYPELGMDARLLPLAALRLAPRQAMGWGHPVTSGLPAIDAYFTCAAMEPPGADAQYTETLLRLPGLGVAYARPDAPPPATHAALGLPEDAPLVLFPQSLFKIHPDNDAVLAALVQRVPGVRLVMFRDPSAPWQARFLARLTPAVSAAIHWLAPVSRARYLQVNRACDLMLDTLRWSGGNTSLDALGCGLPLITCPGATMRARQSTAMLAALGVAEALVVDTPTALAERAAQLLADAEGRQALSMRILAGLPALFAAGPARTAFLEAIDTLCTKA